MEKFLIIKDCVKKVRRFNLHGRVLEFKLRDVPAKTEPVSWIKEAIGGVIRKATENLMPTDQVAFNFGCKDLARGEGWIRFRPIKEITLDDVWDVISNIYQSNSSGLNTETFCLGVTSVRMPKGKGKGTRGKNYNTFEEECSKRKGIIVINNKDNLCLPRALVVAKAFVDKDPDFVKIRRDIAKLQTTRARQLIGKAAVEIPKEGAGIPEVEQFQKHLRGYRVIVYKYGVKGRDVIFESGECGGKNLNLIYHDGHYNTITSLTAAFCCDYYCETCHVPYNDKNKHRCGGTCAGCRQTPACEMEIKIKCGECLRFFRNQHCFDHHKRVASYETAKTVCEQIRLCTDCLKTIKTGRKHTCGEIFCRICQLHQPEGHLCFMQSDKGKAKTKGVLFVFYDLETRQETERSDGCIHEPNLCVFKQRCEECLNANEACLGCGVIVIKENVISQFTSHLLQIRKKYKDVIVLAHNGQAFDHQFILNYILTETDLTPELIMRGTKIILMQLGNIKFLDSLNYFPMSLAALPKAFGLEDNIKKGYFPHLFNKAGNQKYFGPLPSIENYSPDTMKEEQREEFLKWHDAHKNYLFDFQKEIVDYCISDVEILSAACLSFRKQMLSTTNVCPFSEACTIASACNKVYRRNFLESNTIGIIPKGGYRFKDKQSKIALQWLIWIEKKLDINIMHAAKGQEALLHGVKVDGYCRATNQVFEFHGCYFHGCPSCFKSQRGEPLPEDPTINLDLRYESTVAKTDRLRSFGYEVIEKWECEFRRELSPEIKNFITHHPLLSTTPLKPRDAFYGGRTGNCKTYYKALEGEKIKYLDVCSLYPWVCKYGKFPVGHPEVFIGIDCKNLDLKKTDGIIKCKILPPKQLFHPVLPHKMNNKLMFVLCRTCGDEMSTYDCTHSEEERVLIGTWVIDEVLKGLEKGYEIQEIYEVWKYEVKQYDMDSKTGGLFVEMMNRFIKIKQEASGWPGDCETKEQKQKYIKNFFNREGIILEFENILKNPGLRCLAKLMLNSFWGKLGQQENHPKTKIVTTPDEFFNMLTNPSTIINAALPINDTILIVNYELKEESFNPLPTVNVCMAAYTTSQARLKLYSYLEQLEERVLYYDTDSVIFTQNDVEFEPPTGDFTGEMTDELESYGIGSYIKEYVSGGPKNYGFILHSSADKKDKIVCKVKGIGLNYAASQVVNFESIKNMILNHVDEPLLIMSNQIRRTKEHEVVTKQETKIYRPNSTKRRFFKDHTSIPYGFKRQKLN